MIFFMTPVNLLLEIIDFDGLATFSSMDESLEQHSSLSFFVRFPDGRCHEFVLPRSTRVGELKQKLCKKDPSIQAERQILIFKKDGPALKDGSSLSEIKITNGSEITCVERTDSGVSIDVCFDLLITSLGIA